MRAIYRNVSLIISKEDVKTLHLCVFIRFYIMCCKRMAWRLEDRIQCQQKMDGHGRSKGVYRTDRLLSSFFFSSFFLIFFFICQSLTVFQPISLFTKTCVSHPCACLDPFSDDIYV